MGIVWFIIMLSGIVVLTFIDPSAALESMIKGANDAVMLSLNLIALYGIWLGVFAIIEQTGAANKLAKILRPLVRFLFKGESEETEKYIAMNMSANFLGLGNAATPMGIGAVGSMKKNPTDPLKASDNMIMLTVISATSLQIFPSTVIGMRAAAGSANPADFLIPCIVATISSTVIGIMGVKLLTKFRRRKRESKKLKERSLA